MQSFPAFADEALVNYLERVLVEVRHANHHVRCTYGTRSFVIAPAMTATDVIRSWFEAESAPLRQAVEASRSNGLRT